MSTATLSRTYDRRRERPRRHGGDGRCEIIQWDGRKNVLYTKRMNYRFKDLGYPAPFGFCEYHEHSLPRSDQALKLKLKPAEESLSFSIMSKTSSRELCNADVSRWFGSRGWPSKKNYPRENGKGPTARPPPTS